MKLASQYLSELAEFLRTKVPDEKFHMRDWAGAPPMSATGDSKIYHPRVIEMDPETLEPICGTVACAAGWAPACFHGDPIFDLAWCNGSPDASSAGDWAFDLTVVQYGMRLTHSEFEECFVLDADRWYGEKRYYCADWPTRLEVAEHLENVATRLRREGR